MLAKKTIIGVGYGLFAMVKRKIVKSDLFFSLSLQFVLAPKKSSDQMACPLYHPFLN